MTQAEKIIYHRNQLGLTQEMLANKSGISIRTIQRLEKGQVIPRHETLKILAKSLAIEPNALMENTRQIEPQEANYLILVNLFAIQLFPFSNILLPFLLIRRKKQNPVVYLHGTHILNFQIKWTISLIILMMGTFLLQLILIKLNGPSIPLLLFTFLFLYLYNLIQIFLGTFRLTNGKPPLYRPYFF